MGETQQNNCHAELVSASYHPTLTLPVQGGKKIAFTLAEVLITLVIIGVIAAITVPTLITKYQKEQTVTRLKKVYSTISQTTVRAIANNGPIETWDISSPKVFAEKYLLPYLAVSKICKNNSADCEYTYKTKANNSIKNFNSNYKFYLNDGTLVIISNIENTNNVKTVILYIDINGKLKPNFSGKDLFSYRYILTHTSYQNTKGKLIANCLGSDLNRENWINHSVWGCKNGDGMCCSAIIMADGWRISDDYPW